MSFVFVVIILEYFLFQSELMLKQVVV